MKLERLTKKDCEWCPSGRRRRRRRRRKRRKKKKKKIKSKSSKFRDAGSKNGNEK